MTSLNDIETATPEKRSTEAVKLTTLGSGVRVVTETMEHVATAACGIWVGAGARHEHAEEHGLAHLLEHMAFKGTKKRSAREIVETIEAGGGEINAETNAEYTAYFARILGENVSVALDVLGDILTEPAFDPEELQREKGVILQEIGSYEDTPDEIVFDMLMETAFSGSSIGRRILGTPETVTAQNKQSIEGFLARNYRTPSIVVSAAGDVSHDAIVTDIEKLLQSVGADRAIAAESAQYIGGDARKIQKLEQAHVVLGFEGLPYSDDRHYALYVFSNLLGGGMSSRLFQEIREKRGLCYEINSFFSPFSDSGVFAIYGGTGQRELKEFMPVLIDVMQAAAETASEEEVARARAQMKMSILTSLESPGRRTEQMARHILAYDRVLSRAELARMIDAITVEDVRAVGRKMLLTAPSVAAIGPIKALMSYDTLTTRLGTARTGRSDAPVTGV